MIDFIEELSCDETWMNKFCRGCKAVTVLRVQGNLRIADERNCPAEFNPFYNSGCVRKHEVEKIEAAVFNAESVIAKAVA